MTRFDTILKSTIRIVKLNLENKLRIPDPGWIGKDGCESAVTAAGDSGRALMWI
jgi:hypothetical protein